MGSHVISPEKILKVIEDVLHRQEGRCAVKKLSRDTLLSHWNPGMGYQISKAYSRSREYPNRCLIIAWERFLRHA
jgi:hypothetical protein